MNEWYCCLLCEGSSDAALTNVLEFLLTRLTSEPASVSARLDLKGSVQDKLIALQKYDAGLYDLVFVHRDADNAGLRARQEEIKRAVDSFQDAAITPVVPVVPVTMTETWALASLFGDPDCRDWLRREASVPEKKLETYRDPKDLLRRLLSRDDPDGKLLPNGVFSVQRARILAELDTAGGSALSRLTAWTALNKALADAIARVRPWLA
jgi:hypothetical protein